MPLSPVTESRSKPASSPRCSSISDSWTGHGKLIYQPPAWLPPKHSIAAHLFFSFFQPLLLSAEKIAAVVHSPIQLTIVSRGSYKLWIYSQTNVFLLQGTSNGTIFYVVTVFFTHLSFLSFSSFLHFLFLSLCFFAAYSTWRARDQHFTK